jgi:predicted ATPase
LLSRTEPLIAKRGRGEIEGRLAKLVHRQSEGNPFFAEELLRALAEDGTLVQQKGTWDVSRVPDSFLPTGIA